MFRGRNPQYDWLTDWLTDCSWIPKETWNLPGGQISTKFPLLGGISFFRNPKAVSKYFSHAIAAAKPYAFQKDEFCYNLSSRNVFGFVAETPRIDWLIDWQPTDSAENLKPFGMANSTKFPLLKGDMFFWRIPKSVSLFRQVISHPKT